jgi:hypothetical protein
VKSSVLNTILGVVFLASLITGCNNVSAIVENPAVFVDSSHATNANLQVTRQNLAFEQSLTEQKITAARIRQTTLTKEMGIIKAEEASILDEVAYEAIPGTYRTYLPTSTDCSLSTSKEATASVTTVEVQLAPANRNSYAQAPAGPDSLFFAVICGNRYVAWSKASGLPVSITEVEATKLLKEEIRLHDIRLREEICLMQSNRLNAEIQFLESGKTQAEESIARLQNGPLS